jgi:tetratricopeptide (TPR) repeat protein
MRPLQGRRQECRRSLGGPLNLPDWPTVLLSPNMPRPTCLPICIAAAILGSGNILAADVEKPGLNPANTSGQGITIVDGKVDVLAVVEEEATRRQATTGVMKRTLARASASEKQKNYWAATFFYEAALARSRQLGGVNVGVETKRAMAGLSNSRIALAKAANKQREFEEADRQIVQLLRLDPENKKALEYRDYNREVAKAHEGRTPSRETLARAGVMMRQKAEINTMVRDGKLFYEMRLLGEAKSKLKQAIKMDPSHRPAYYYLSLIQEAQYGDAARKRDLMQKERLVDVEREWNEFLK